jgi:hypothetical protein
MEYLYAVSGNNGKRFVYELAFYSEDEEEASGMRGLASVEQLKEQLKENGNGSRAKSLDKRASGSAGNLAVEKATLR